MGVRARKHRGGEMNSLEFTVFANKDIRPEELTELFGSVGWGEAAAYSMADVECSLAAYPFIAHARDREGKLVGYISAFCDGSFSAFIGELAVHPSVQRQGIGTALLRRKRTPEMSPSALIPLPGRKHSSASGATAARPGR